MTAIQPGRLARVLESRGGQAPPEAPLVIEHREALIYMLCEAAELEHGIMCQYLFAAFSLKQRSEEGLSDEQLEAVRRWRKVIAHVATEEMLHLALVHNLLSAIGAAPHFARPNLPAPAHHYPAGVNLALVPFGETALRHFMFLERPEGMQLRGAEGLDAALAQAAPLMGEDEIVPRGQDFATVGHLYRSIEHGFDRLAEKYGEPGLFVGPPRAQATSKDFHWPELVAVSDLESAHRAIDTILEQGEGARGHWEDAHFGQFVRILDEYLQFKASDPGFDPTRPVLAAKVRPGERDVDPTLIGDPLTARCVDLFNVAYEVLLQTFERYFAHTEETDAQLSTLADVTIDLMVRVLSPLGEVVTTLPVGTQNPGRTAGPSFELFYETDYLMPHREAAWALLEERLRECGNFCERTKSECDETLAARLAPVEDSLRDIADSLAAHFREWGAVSRYAVSGQRPSQAAHTLERASELLGRAGAGALLEPLTAAAGDAEEIWPVARAATDLYLRNPADVVLGEAVAHLQRLALEGVGAGERAERLAELRALQAELPAVIRVVPGGPYLVSNPASVRNWLGEELEVAPQMALCRCGASASKPFCDGSEVASGFTDGKSPTRAPDRRDTYAGIELTVFDNRGICQHSGFCTDRLNTVFRTDQEPFVAPSGGRMDEIIRAVRACPSGALSYAMDGVEARQAVDRHGTRVPGIEVSKDGPYRVTGAMPLLDGDGGDVARAEGSSREHYALCRCGQSQNKPFCSGMHWYVDFKDPPTDPAASLYVWAGGRSALERTTRLFYERRVTVDPLLAPLFSDAPPDEPERLAAWLGEVLGGPERYAERYTGRGGVFGGAGQLTEEQRGRWVSLLFDAAREAGLPQEAEFQVALRACLDWCSRAGTGDDPIPQWSWDTGAGRPAAQASDEAPGPEEPPVVLPAADEPVNFEAHVKPLFRERDRRSMQFAFDLWSADDVRDHGTDILARLQDGSMPCDGTWPPEWVAVFERWLNSAPGEA